MCIIFLKGEQRYTACKSAPGRPERVPSDPPWHRRCTVIDHRGVEGAWTLTCPSGHAIACDRLRRIGTVYPRRARHRTPRSASGMVIQHGDVSRSTTRPNATDRMSAWPNRARGRRVTILSRRAAAESAFIMHVKDEPLCAARKSARGDRSASRPTSPLAPRARGRCAVREAARRRLRRTTRSP